MRYILYSFFLLCSLTLFVTAAHAQFDTTYVEPAKDTTNVPVFDITSPGTTNVNFQGDPANGNNAHHINFQNTSPVSIVFKSASLTSSNSHFQITQFLPALPDTVKPNGKFTIIMHFNGDTSGTVYQDTIVLNLDHALVSYYVGLKGTSYNSANSGVLQNPSDISGDFLLSPNPTSGIVSVKSLSPKELNIAVINILGNSVMELKNVHSPDFTLDLSKLVSGAYYIRFSSASSVVTKAIIKK